MDEITKLLSTFPNGATENDITTHYPNMTKEKVVSILNTLLNNQKIDVINDNGKYRYKISFNHKDKNEKTVYNLIKESGAKGIWLRDIKLKTNMAQSLINKTLKSLEHKLLIKAIKSVKSNRKVYILYDEVPGEELTGGVWFTECDVDEEFVNEIMKVVYAFLCKKSRDFDGFVLHLLPKIKDIQQFITESKIITEHVNFDDLQVLLNVMVADEMIQEVIVDGISRYRALKQ